MASFLNSKKLVAALGIGVQGLAAASDSFRLDYARIRARNGGLIETGDGSGGSFQWSIGRVGEMVGLRMRGFHEFA